MQITRPFSPRDQVQIVNINIARVRQAFLAKSLFRGAKNRFLSSGLY